MARHFLGANQCESLYYNWDLRKIRNAYRSDPGFFESAMREVKSKDSLPWICFDEIHKMPKWKNILKASFDEFERDCRFIVTGSARLEWFPRSGDSLAGRYFLFHLNPLSLSEAAGNTLAEPEPDESAGDFFERKLSRGRPEQHLMEQLLQYGGFPEPFTRARAAFYRRWQRDMEDYLTREDIRDLTRILSVEHVAALLHILPDRVGSPLSLNSLREDVETSYTSIRNAIRAMELTHAVFLISPYSRKIARSVKKERKLYFYDCGRCRDLASRFENYVAVELKTMTELWHDKGIGNFSVGYIRTRDGKETDFLITRDRKPWCLFEAKLQDEAIARHHLDQAEALLGIPVVQVVRQSGVYRKQPPNNFRCSASRLFC